MIDWNGLNVARYSTGTNGTELFVAHVYFCFVRIPFAADSVGHTLLFAAAGKPQNIIAKLACYFN